jgi:uncharacterized DUF497 family protein
VLFDWDEANRQHIAEHNISTTEAEEFIANDPIDLDCQDDEDEERFLQVGETGQGRILLVVSTMRGEWVRVVTAFDAPKKWRTYYLSHRVNFYGTETRDPEV